MTHFTWFVPSTTHFIWLISFHFQWYVWTIKRHLTSRNRRRLAWTSVVAKNPGIVNKWSGFDLRNIWKRKDWCYLVVCRSRTTKRRSKMTQNKTHGMLDAIKGASRWRRFDGTDTQALFSFLPLGITLHPLISLTCIQGSLKTFLCDWLFL